MNTPKLALAAMTAAVLAAPALAQDCTARIDDFDRLLDRAAEDAISASSGGQAVAGAREAQAVEEEGPDDEDPVPFQEEPEAEAAVDEADRAGDGGESVIDARADLQEARDLAEEGNEAACMEALDQIILELIRN